MTVQADELERVSSRIGAAIVGFCQRLGPGGEFYADDLRQHVLNACQSAPASPDRVLRALRQVGKLNYEVVSRSKSLYRVLAVEPRCPGFLFSL